MRRNSAFSGSENADDRVFLRRPDKSNCPGGGNPGRGAQRSPFCRKLTAAHRCAGPEIKLATLRNVTGGVRPRATRFPRPERRSSFNFYHVAVVNAREPRVSFFSSLRRGFENFISRRFETRACGRFCLFFFFFLEDLFRLTVLSLFAPSNFSSV